MIGNCKYCGNEFIKKKHNHAYCSTYCNESYKKSHPSAPYANPKEYKKVCKFCLKEYIAKTHSSVFCSSDCRDSHTESKKAPITAMKFWLFARDNFKCIYCGRSPIEDGVKLIPEHIFPRHAGGQNTFYNLATACIDCNTEKFGWILPRQIILWIWQRNKKLGVKSPYRWVDEIINEFEKTYPSRTIDLKQSNE